MNPKQILFHALLYVLLLLPLRATAADDGPAASIDVERRHFGSGTPAQQAVNGTETASPVADGLYHAPNYLPGFPTAATIWPREVPVDCERGTEPGKISCGGFQVLPAMGRGEYLFIRPVVKAAQQEQAPAPPPPPEPVPISKKIPLG